MRQVTALTDVDREVLRSRIRLGLILVLLTSSAFAVLDVLRFDGNALRLILTFKLIRDFILISSLLLLPRLRGERAMVALGIANGAISQAIVAGEVIAGGDASTIFVVGMGQTLGGGLLIPWGYRAQAVLVLAVMAWSAVGVFFVDFGIPVAAVPTLLITIGGMLVSIVMAWRVREDFEVASAGRRALSASEDRWRTVTELVSDAVYEWDWESQEIWASAKLASHLGHVPGQTGDGAWWRSQVHPDDFMTLKRFVSAKLAEGADGWTTRFRLRRADGSWAHVLDRARVRRATEGGGFRVIGTLSDDTTAFAHAQWAERIQRQQAALSAITNAVREGGHLVHVLPCLVEQTAMALGVERASVWRLSRSRLELRCVVQYEASIRTLSSGHVVRAHDFPNYFRALRKGTMICAEDARNDAHTAEFASILDEIGITSVLDVPVLIYGKPAGVVCHEHCGPTREWQPDERTFALAIASLASMILEGFEREKAESRYRELVDLSPSAIFILRDLRILFANRCAVQLLTPGNRDELVGRSLLELVHAEDHDAIRLVTQAIGVARPRNAAITQRMIRADGSLVYVDLTVGDCDYGGAPAVQVIAHDVSDRDRLLREQSERITMSNLAAEVGMILARGDEPESMLRGCARAIMKHLGVAGVRFWLCHPQSVELTIAASAGVTLDTPFGGDIRALQGESPIALVAQARTPVIINDLSVDERGGVREWARREGISAWMGLPLSVPDRVVGVISILSRRAMRAHERQDLATLADAIAVGVERRLTEAKLREATAQAEAGNRAKSQFLATMSHEIRTPLNGVLGMAQLLEMSDLDERQREFVDVIQKSGQSLLATINDVLDFSKIEAGKVDLYLAPMRIDSVLNEALAPLRLTAAEKGIHLECLVNPSTPRVIITDSARLRQVLINLLGNAVKFSDGGTVRVSVDSTPQPGGSHRIRFSVRDEGIGIAPERHSLLFQPFQQLDASLTRRYGGTGLGLAISKRTVELLGGSMWVESGAGVGSTFHFDIVADQGYETETPHAQHGTPRLLESSPLSVLVAEDAPFNQAVIRSMLVSLGHEAEVVADVARLVDAMTRRRYDAVLIDLGMLAIGSLSALDALLAGVPPEQRSYVVVLTTQLSDDDAATYERVGVRARLSKPVSISALSGVLRNVARPVSDPPAPHAVYA